MCLLADFANTAEGGKLNVMGVFDRILAKEFPTRHQSMYLVVRTLHEYSDSETTHDFVFKIESPDGASVVNIEAKGEIGTMEPGQYGNMNQIIHLQGVEFERSGTYMVRVSIDGEPAAEVPLILARGNISG